MTIRGCELPPKISSTPSTPVPSDVSPALNSSRILIVGLDSAQLRPARSGALHLRSGVSGALSLAAKMPQSIPAQLTFPLFSTRFQMTDIEKPAEKQTEISADDKSIGAALLQVKRRGRPGPTDRPFGGTAQNQYTRPRRDRGSSYLRDLPSKFHDPNRPRDRARRTAAQHCGVIISFLNCNNHRKKQWRGTRTSSRACWASASSPRPGASRPR